MQNLVERERIAGESVPHTPPQPQPTTPHRSHYKAWWKAGFQAGWQAGFAEAQGDALAVPQTPSDLSPPYAEPQPDTPVWTRPQPVHIDAKGWTHVSSEALDL